MREALTRELGLRPSERGLVMRTTLELRLGSFLGTGNPTAQTSQFEVESTLTLPQAKN